MTIKKYCDFMPNYNWQISDIRNYKGAFASERAIEYHTGIDIYCPENTQIYSIEPGTIVAIETFTGAKADCPWYLETYSILVQGKDCVFLYGELLPNVELKVGAHIKENQYLGHIIPVLTKDKGNGTTMLHFEMYKLGTTKSVFWYKNDPQPENLLDPTTIIETILKQKYELQTKI